MLATVPNKGENDILITHKPNIIDALGKDWFDVREAGASMFKPEGSSPKAANTASSHLTNGDRPKLAAFSK